MNCNLVNKYNVPGPRYTSYPTVPFWNADTFSLEQWKASLKASFAESKEEGISLYIHLPYCESLCTFCGCNKRITKRHEVEKPYIEYVLREWELYCELLPERPSIKELHLGGGTPTFFSPEHLRSLIQGILESADLAPGYEFSFEGHPNNTTKVHLQTLFDLGFRRVSFGVQDYNEKVQKAIHRVQPFENVKRVTEAARAIGYTSIGHDLIFGLPFQEMEHIQTTIENTKALKPDRIAFYGYAHTPWIKGNGQRGFNEQDLPSAESRRQQYENGKALLEQVGYKEIGMDHFALPTDSMYTAMKTEQLHRNFMGYTASKTQMMIGLGVSAIGDSWYAFAQNAKDIESYKQLIDEGLIPVFRGHILNEEDLIIRKHILGLMCQFKTSWENKEECFDALPQVVLQLKEMEEDHLIEIGENNIKITEKGVPFVRNVCMAFDVKLQQKSSGKPIFSMTI